MKPANLKALKDAIGLLGPIPLDEGFTPETLELAKLIHQLVIYTDKVTKPVKQP